MKAILKRTLFEKANNANPEICDELRDLGFRSHSKCYVDSGFCSMVLSLRNLYGLVFALEFGREFVGKHWKESWSQVMANQLCSVIIPNRLTYMIVELDIV